MESKDQVAEKPQRAHDAQERCDHWHAPEWAHPARCIWKKGHRGLHVGGGGSWGSGANDDVVSDTDPLMESQKLEQSSVPIPDDRLIIQYEDVPQVDAAAAEQYAVAYVCKVGATKESMVDAVSTLRAITVAYDRELLAARERIASLTAQVATLEQEKAAAQANPKMGDCRLCGASIWAKDARIDNGAGMAHVTCEIKAAAHEAGFEEARNHLKDYFAKHGMGVKDVIQSQWARGVHSGRQEAINVLDEAIRSLSAPTKEQQGGEK